MKYRGNVAQNQGDHTGNHEGEEWQHWNRSHVPEVGKDLKKWEIKNKMKKQDAIQLYLPSLTLICLYLPVGFSNCLISFKFAKE